MKNIIILILVFLLIPTVSFSRSLAVRPFTDIGDTNLGELVADYISVELIRSRQLSVISPSSVSGQLKEAEIIESGCSSDECNIAIAELLQTEYLVFGEIRKTKEGDYIILYQLYRTIKKSVIHMKEVKTTFDSINDTAKNIAEDLLHWTTGKQAVLFEHKDCDDGNLSTLHGKVTEIYGLTYLLNVGWANGLKKNSYIYVMDGDDIGAVLRITTIFPNTSTARLVVTKKKSFQISVGSLLYIPDKKDKLRFMSRNKFTIIASLPFSNLGVRYEYGMYYKLKPSVELLIGNFSALVMSVNWYLRNWIALHYGIGLFYGEVRGGDSVEWYPSLASGVKFSFPVTSAYVIEVNFGAFGQAHAIIDFGVGVTF